MIEVRLDSSTKSPAYLNLMGQWRNLLQTRFLLTLIYAECHVSCKTEFFLIEDHR